MENQLDYILKNEKIPETQIVWFSFRAYILKPN